MSGAPDPKSRSLDRPRKRYRRVVASRKQWEKIAAEKQGSCRCCFVVGGNGKMQETIEFHHVVSRQDGGGDLADNIVPVCNYCHDALTRRDPRPAKALLSRLTDAEYAYMIERGGEDYPERAYGVTYER